MEAGRLAPVVAVARSRTGSVRSTASRSRCGCPPREPVRISGRHRRAADAALAARGARFANGRRSKRGAARRSTRSPAAPTCRSCRCRCCSGSPSLLAAAAAVALARWRPQLDRRRAAARARRDVRRRVARARRALAMESRAAGRVTATHLRRQGLARAAPRRRGRPAVRSSSKRRARSCRRRRRACSWSPTRTISAAAAPITSIRTTSTSIRGRNTLPPSAALRAGDYLVVFQRRGVQFDAAQRSCAGTAARRSPRRRCSSSPAPRCSGFAEWTSSRFIVGLMLPWLLGIAALAALRDTDAPAGRAGRDRLDRRRGLSRRRVPADALDARAVARRHPLRRARDRVRRSVSRRPRCRRRVAPARRRALVDRACSSALRALVAPPGVARATRIAWQLLLAWLALRFALLALDVDVAAALSVGRVDPVGDQGARLVRARPHRPVRACATSGSPPAAPSGSTRRPNIRRRSRCCRSGPASRSAAGTTR